MTGIISGIKRMEIHDGDGLRTTVFFKGCPLSCIWCHNPESLEKAPQIATFHNKCISCGSCNSVCKKHAVINGWINHTLCIGCGACAEACPTEALKLYGEEWEATALFRHIMQDEAFFRSSGGGVTFSGGECLLQIDFIAELASMFYSAGISVDIDTCGCVPRASVERILPYTDTFLYDVKAVDLELHKKLTGVDNILILENLRYISEQNANIEIRVPLVKGYNDSEITAIARLLKDINGIKKVKVLKYHALAASRYDALGLSCTMPDTETTISDVDSAVEILRAYGLNAVNGASDD